MRIGFVVNRASELHPEQTTAMLLQRSAARGHETWVIEVGALGQAHDGRVMGRGRRVEAAADVTRVLLDLGPAVPLDLHGLDLVVVRTNPARDDRLWAHQAALVLLRVLAASGVSVTNDPAGLVWATSKLHLATLPASIRPRTLVSRDLEALTAFVDEAPGDVVLKPVTGTRGRDVFRVGRDRQDNLPQILDVLVRQGLAMAQDYVPEAADGDVRLILLDGRLLEVDGCAAAVRRVPPSRDFRSNVAVGGRPAPVDAVTPVMRRVAEIAGPVLMADGLRLAGLDLVGDRVVEVNVFSPGGLFDGERYCGVDFTGAIVDAWTRTAVAPGPAGR